MHTKQPPMSEDLTEHNVHPNPIEQFRSWLQMAQQSGMKHPDAMTLATCTEDGHPSARMVLLRGLDERGFAFYTNYKSRKSLELGQNPHAALVFYWEPLDRQVRVEGQVERVSDEQSDDYFQSRPRGSQIGAWASPQSQVIANRAELEQRFDEVNQKHSTNEQVNRPPFWGGYRVRPTVIEFWYNQSDRLHDRIRYRKNGDEWIIERLAP